MIKNIEKANEMTLHTAKEQKASPAQLLFNWNDCVAETEKEYLSRIRRRRLICIMKKIIKDELDAQQKEILEKKHFENKSYEEIGRELYMSGSAVIRSCKKAEKTVAAYMKYVIDFSDMGMKNDDKPFDVKMAIAELMLENSTQDKVGSRLRKARKDKLITLSKTAFCTGIPEERIKTIEETGAAYSSELKKLIAFYGTSADYVMFGAR